MLLVFNPRSSHFWQVERDILTKVRELRGWMVGKYEISDTDVDDNARKLSKIVMDGDVVVAAGGDGTANIAVNGILLSGATGVKFGVMGYGNFNDMALKTVIRRLLSKYGYLSVEMQNALSKDVEDAQMSRNDLISENANGQAIELDNAQYEEVDTETGEIFARGEIKESEATPAENAEEAPSY